MQLVNSFFGGRASVAFKTSQANAESRIAPRQLTTCMAKKKGEAQIKLVSTPERSSAFP